MLCHPGFTSCVTVCDVEKLCLYMHPKEHACATRCVDVCLLFPCACVCGVHQNCDRSSQTAFLQHCKCERGRLISHANGDGRGLDSCVITVKYLKRQVRNIYDIPCWTLLEARAQQRVNDRGCKERWGGGARHMCASAIKRERFGRVLNSVQCSLPTFGHLP